MEADGNAAGSIAITHPTGFNPNDRRYKACCCHVKIFTIVSGIIEIFTICFLLVAVLPDINSRVCNQGNNRLMYLYIDDDIENQNGSSGNLTTIPTVATTTITIPPPDFDNISTLENSTSEYEKFMASLTSTMCSMNIVWLVWAIAQILVINIVFYGIKHVRWLLFMPHFVFRVVDLALFSLILSLEIYSVTANGNATSSSFVAIAFTSILMLLWVYVTTVEIRCAHFVKRSQETGYSISVARPIGPSTVSLSERDAPPAASVRQLPPLRHTYGVRDPSRKYQDN